MKLIVFAACLAVASCQVDLTTFDWSTVKHLWEIQEWRDANPKFEKPKGVVERPHLGLLSRSSRIIGGDVAGPTDYPYMAGILLHFDTGNSFCGGTLISRRFVLTAANCVFVVPSSSVLLGASDMLRNIEANILVQRTRVHPLYDNSQSLNDIATLELSREVTLSATIGLVRLPNRRQAGSSFENQQGIIAGWGRTSGSGNQPIPTQFLRTLRSQVITNLSCRLRYPAFITASNICSDANDGTPCSGDEGGPLMIMEADQRRTQVGVFSYQFSLGCERGWPAVYARVTSFLDFIEENSDVRILETWE